VWCVNRVDRISDIRQEFSYSARRIVHVAFITFLALHYFACFLWFIIRVQNFPSGACFSFSPVFSCSHLKLIWPAFLQIHLMVCSYKKLDFRHYCCYCCYIAYIEGIVSSWGTFWRYHSADTDSGHVWAPVYQQCYIVCPRCLSMFFGTDYV
jgi:hypothetical protein